MGTNSAELDDDEENVIRQPNLVFVNDELPASLLKSLNLMRKNNTFCDVILHVDNTDIPCHRAVLGSVSPHLLQLFTTDDEKLPRQSQNIISYKLNGVYEKNALEKLIDYAYTSRLELEPTEVKSVYSAAVHLSMDKVASLCSDYLVDTLTVDSALVVRSLPGVTRRKRFVSAVDSFISENMSEISKSSAFLSLPTVRIEILSGSREEMSLVDPASMCRLAYDWLKTSFSNVCPQSLETSITGKTHMLYLALDNSLQDCSQLPNGDAGDTELVQDYKRLSKLNADLTKKQKGTAKSRVIVYSRQITHAAPDDGSDDRLIASTTVTAANFLSLVTIGGRLVSVSLLLRLNPPSSAPDEPSSLNSYSDLPPMSGPKCSSGVVELEGQILVAGGYDRAECLSAVEAYCPLENKWRDLSPMLEPRGRFSIGVVSGKAFAVGGSNGTTELDTVESYSMDQNKWEKSTKLPSPRSHTAVTSLNSLIYSVGGYDGNSGLRDVDTLSNGWTPISPLSIGRYQAVVAEYGGRLWVVGGCDGWNCLSSVETLDPREGRWTPGPNLTTPRRGAGLQEFQGKLYCVGGWDGSHSLATTETLDLRSTGSWSPGPVMTSPRSNLGLVTLNPYLYAVGGFSSKTFLNSIEILSDGEWSTFCLSK